MEHTTLKRWHGEEGIIWIHLYQARIVFLKDSKKTLPRERDRGGEGGCGTRKMICLMEAMFSCIRNAVSDIKNEHLEGFDF